MIDQIHGLVVTYHRVQLCEMLNRLINNVFKQVHVQNLIRALDILKYDLNQFLCRFITADETWIHP